MFFQRALLLIVIPILAFVWWSSFTFPYEDPKEKKQPPGVKIFVATFSAGFCLGVGILAGGAVVAVQSFLRRDKGVLGEHTLAITDEGLVESTAVNRSLANWGTSFRIRETGRYAYIFVSDTNAHVVPKTSPPLEGSVDEFLNALRARIKQIEQGPPIPPLIPPPA